MTANPTELARSPLLADMAAQFAEIARAMTDGHAAGLQPNHVIDLRSEASPAPNTPPFLWFEVALDPRPLPAPMISHSG